MSIIEKRKTELTYNEHITIFIPRLQDKLNEYEYIKTELDKLKEIENKNIKLALKLKELTQKYDEMKNQHNQDIKMLINQKKIIDKLNFTLYCPELKKEIDFYNCCESCYHKFCKPLYRCEKRLKEIESYFKI